MKIIGTQKNSKSCIICGFENEIGVKAKFYNLEDGSAASLFSFKFEHQSYTGRVHGGMIGALLDELMGRVLWVTEPDCYGVTTTMNITYRKPVPYDTPLKARAYITFNSKRGFDAKGELYDMDGKLLAEGSGRYLKLPAKMIAPDADMDVEMCYSPENDLTEIDFPPLPEIK